MIGSVSSPGGCGLKDPPGAQGGWPGRVALASGAYLLVTLPRGRLPCGQVGAHVEGCLLRGGLAVVLF